MENHTHSASEVGAFPCTWESETNIDLNTLINVGNYTLLYEAGSKETYHLPTNDITHINLLVIGNDTRVTQIATLPFSHEKAMYIRYKHDNSWFAWNKLSTENEAYQMITSGTILDFVNKNKNGHGNGFITVSYQPSDLPSGVSGEFNVIINRDSGQNARRHTITLLQYGGNTPVTIWYRCMFDGAWYTEWVQLNQITDNTIQDLIINSSLNVYGSTYFNGWMGCSGGFTVYRQPDLGDNDGARINLQPPISNTGITGYPLFDIYQNSFRFVTSYNDGTGDVVKSYNINVSRQGWGGEIYHTGMMTASTTPITAGSSLANDCYYDVLE